jgi:pimeloyl-ACP methyl ester carboxylesterase
LSRRRRLTHDARSDDVVSTDVPERRSVVVRERPVSYREAGTGMPVVVAAGLGLSSRFYEQSYGAFAAGGARLVVADLPGRGDTPGARTGSGPVQTAGFLIDFADALGIEHAVWVGHSLGAQVVAEVAVRRPSLAAGLVLAGPTGERHRLDVLRQAGALAVEAQRTTLRVVGAVARDYLRVSPLHYFGTWLRHARHDLASLISLVECPVLILAGERDPVSRRAFVELLQQCAPRADVQWVPGGTHALPRAHPVEFNRRVLDYVRRLDGT